MIVRELVALLGVETKKEDFQKAEKGMGRIIDVAKKAVAAFAAFKLGQWAKNATEDIAKLGDQFDKMSQRLGVSTKFLQEWSLVADLAGASLETMETAVRRLQNSVDQAQQGSKLAKEGFERLGIVTKTASGRFKTAEELMPELADAFAKMEDVTLKAALSQQLLGRSGTMLLPLLNQGSKAIREQRKEAEELGSNMEKKLIAQSVKYIDNQARMTRVTIALKNAIARGLLPFLNKVIDRFIIWWKANQKWITSGITRTFKTFTRIVGALGRGIRTIVGRFKALTKELSPLQKNILKIGTAIGVIVGLLMLPMGPLFLIAGIVGLIIDDFLVWQEDGESLIGILVEGFKKLTGIDLVKFFKDSWRGIKGVIEKVTKSVAALGELLIGIFTGDFERALKKYNKLMKKEWKDTIKTMEEVWDGFIFLFERELEQAWEGFKFVFGFIGEWFKDLWNSIVSWFSDNVIAPIAKFFENLWKDVKNIGKRIKNFFSNLWTDFINILKDMKKAITDWAKNLIEKIKAPFIKIKGWISGIFGDDEEEERLKRLEKRARRLERIRRVGRVGRDIISKTSNIREGFGAGQRLGQTNQSFVNKPQTNMNVTINAQPGMNEKSIADEVTKKVREEIDRNNRNAMNAFTIATEVAQ